MCSGPFLSAPPPSILSPARSFQAELSCLILFLLFRAFFSLSPPLPDILAGELGCSCFNHLSCSSLCLMRLKRTLSQCLMRRASPGLLVFPVKPLLSQHAGWEAHLGGCTLYFLQRDGYVALWSTCFPLEEPKNLVGGWRGAAPSIKRTWEHWVHVPDTAQLGDPGQVPASLSLSFSSVK